MPADLQGIVVDNAIEDDAVAGTAADHSVK